MPSNKSVQTQDPQIIQFYKIEISNDCLYL